MLEKPYPWATTQMPLSVLDGQFRSFQQKVLPVLNQRGIGPIGMKSLGGNGKIVTDGVVSIEEALRYVFSLPIATLVSGIDSEKVLDQNLKIVREFKPMTAEEMTAVLAKVGRSPATAGTSCSRPRRCTTAHTTASSTAFRAAVS